jgi:hypothetical protein
LTETRSKDRQALQHRMYFPEPCVHRLCLPIIKGSKAW